MNMKLLAAALISLPLTLFAQNGKPGPFMKGAKPSPQLKTTAVSYGLHIFNQPYASLSSPVSLTNNIPWDAHNDIAVPLGFDFKLFDAVNDTLFLFSEGAVFSTRPASSATVTDTLSVLVAFGADLWDRALASGSMSSQSPVGFKVEGAAPNRIGKVQFTNAGFFNDTEDSVFVNFQVWFYETSNNIEIRFGNSFMKNEMHMYDGKPGVAVGLLDGVILDPLTVLNQSYVLTGAANAPQLELVSSTVAPDTAVNGTPSYGKVFQFLYNGSGTVNDVPETGGKESRVVLAPNPAGDFVRVQTDVQTTLNAAITDLTGKLLLQTKAQDNSMIDIRSLPSGLYLVHLSADGYQPVTRKLIKR